MWAFGSAGGGISVFVQNDRLVLDYNAFGDHTVVSSEQALPTGGLTLGVRLTRDSPTSGVATLLIDGVVAGEGPLPTFMRMVSSLGASIGFDRGSSVSPRYAGAFPFTGTLHEVVIQLPARSRDAGPAAAARVEMARQ